MKILGIDPALTEAAAALLVAGTARDGILSDVWRIRVEGKAFADRVHSLGAQVENLIGKVGPDLVVVETPAEQSRGGRGAYRGRAMMSGPVYGAAVGAVVLAVQKWAAATGLRAMFPSVNDWTARGIPSSKDDTHKSRRVAYVANLYGREPAEFGPKSVAGNAADAVLIARWGLWRAT